MQSNRIRLARLSEEESLDGDPDRLSIARASSALRSPCTTLAPSIMRDMKAGCQPPDVAGRK